MTSIKILHEKWSRELLVWLLWLLGIRHCEWRSCKSTFGIAPAHRVKRRFIGKDRNEYFTAAYLCTEHHHFVEHGDRKHRGTHRRMRRLINCIIARRSTRTDNINMVNRHLPIPPEEPDRTQIKTKERSKTMREEIDGYRRTSTKTRDKAKALQKKEELESRGEEVMIMVSAGIYYVYVKKEKPLAN